MAIGGKQAARGLASRGQTPSKNASPKTKAAFTKMVKSGQIKPTANGVQINKGW